jgi:hypothetical protein
MRLYGSSPRKKPGAGPSVQKLVQRLRDEHDLAIPDDFYFQSTYAGHWQRSAGAWSWWIHYPAEGGGFMEIGSQWSVTELLRNKKQWDVGRDHSHLRALTIIPDMTPDQ